MKKRFALLLLAPLWLGAAPFQCGSTRSTPRVHEDSPSEALWRLAERFHAAGDANARRTTLDELIERYPTSREAERARNVIAGGQPE